MKRELLEGALDIVRRGDWTKGEFGFFDEDLLRAKPQFCLVGAIARTYEVVTSTQLYDKDWVWGGPSDMEDGGRELRDELLTILYAIRECDPSYLTKRQIDSIEQLSHPDDVEEMTETIAGWNDESWRTPEEVERVLVMAMEMADVARS